MNEILIWVCVFGCRCSIFFFCTYCCCCVFYYSICVYKHSKFSSSRIVFIEFASMFSWYSYIYCYLFLVVIYLLFIYSFVYCFWFPYLYCVWVFLLDLHFFSLLNLVCEFCLCAIKSFATEIRIYIKLMTTVNWKSSFKWHSWNVYTHFIFSVENSNRINYTLSVCMSVNVFKRISCLRWRWPKLHKSFTP